MRKLLILSIVAASAALSSSAFAQVAGPKTGTPPLSPSGKAHKHAHKGMKAERKAALAKLNLTPDQRAKIDAHDKEMAADRKIIAKSEPGTKGAGKSEAVKEKLKALRKENHEFYKETLTKEQRKELKQLRREAKREAAAKSAPTLAKP